MILKGPQGFPPNGCTGTTGVIADLLFRFYGRCAASGFP
jgi:hypothetical protein